MKYNQGAQLCAFIQLHAVALVPSRGEDNQASQNFGLNCLVRQRGKEKPLRPVTSVIILLDHGF